MNHLSSKQFHHHEQTKNVNVTAEIKPAVHSPINVLLKTLFTKQLCQQSPILRQDTAAVNISIVAITIIQKHFAINIIKTIQNFLNISITLKTQDFIITLPGVLLLMPQHTDVVQEDVISVSQKSTSQHVPIKKSFKQRDRNHLETPAQKQIYYQGHKIKFNG